MPSDKLPPEIRERIEAGPHPFGDFTPSETPKDFATRIALASLRHAARECARLCEASVSEAWDEFMDGANARSQTCVSAINRYAASLAEETILPQANIHNSEHEVTASRPAGSATEREGLESIPEYFAKPKVTEALAETHPVLLVRQMANEILRLRALDSGPTSEEEAIRVGCTAADVHLTCGYPECTCSQIPHAIRAVLRWAGKGART